MSEKIVLGKDIHIDALYGCFRFDNPKGERFSGERDVEIIARTGRKTKVIVPESMKISLDAGSKAAYGPNFFLEPIGKHTGTMKLLTTRAGWNQNDRDIERLVSYDPEGTFVAKIKSQDYDIPVGTCSVLPVGLNHTWIGMILVHPELRRQGIARAMMKHCTEYALKKKKIINGLDATPLGNTVYGAVGYVDSYRIWRSFYELEEFSDKSYDSTRVRQAEDKDLNDLVKYDAERFMPREKILRALYEDSEGMVYIYRGGSGEVSGYVMGRLGRIRPFVGPFIADNDEIAVNLLTVISSVYYKKGEGTAFIDMPEDKFASTGTYVKGVFDQEKKPSNHRFIKSIKPVRDFVRMYQVVNEKSAQKLVDEFRKHENLSGDDPRVSTFEKLMYRAVENYTQTFAFMEFEKSVLQKKFYGTTGPEKG